MKSIRLFLALAVLFLAGCASTNPMISPTEDQTLPAPPADKAQIVFLNPNNAVAAAFLTGLYDVKGDEKEFYGMLGSKTKLIQNVAPGHHLFMGHTMLANAHFLEANVEAGKRYYVLLRFVYGRGLQLRPLRVAAGSEFSIENPLFNEWNTGSSFVVKTADADAWYAKYKSVVDEAQTKGWAEWQGKNDAQKAELTLNKDDATDK